ncbi:lytic transglycosylase domain-containing protein [Aurantimicrobium minutum]|uniref:lytic transglycosylase domain-containing protein n=1 Tax=Aurantimicrobium minutum TaxID=708131 RepID=UPI0024735ED9|nr:lytic transglycosylase domain-containing protein [Aurantimicrobium minutum]MDH6238780.1 membrane-bound lytic murein transglycosylase B [Aurantimicrobium minutum]
MASKRVRRNRTLTVFAVFVLGIWWFTSCVGGQSSVAENTPTATPTPTPTVDEFAISLLPEAAALPPVKEGVTNYDLANSPVAGLADPAWVKATSEKTGIPKRVLTAYAGVALQLNAYKPECKLSWNTLAGIGWVESRHGTIFGGKVKSNGNMSEPIYGIPLDGKNNTKALPDFDDGNFDGTAEFDRAVGPMQFIPPTWAAWHSDGNGDGIEDGQNIDDSAFAAGRYLCFSGGDLSTPEGWRKALRGYNASNHYAQDVSNKAKEYAEKAK